MTSLVDLTGGLLSRGLQALMPLLRRYRNDELLERLPKHPSPELRALLALAPLPSRDSAYFLVNFLRHLDTRNLSSEQIRERVHHHLLRPVLASEQARRKARREHGLSGLQSLILTPTVACNLRCEHCYNLYEIHEQRKDHLSLAAMKRVLAEGRALGAYRVSVIGGEPLLRWRDLAALASGFPDVLFTIFTNGLLLSPEVTDALVAPGNVELAVSIDGPEAMHDAWRGAGSFQKAQEALRAFTRAGGLAMVSPTVTAKNFQALLGDDFLDQMAEHGAYMAYLHHYDLLGGQARRDWLLTRDQLLWMRQRIEEIHRKKPLAVLSNVTSDLIRGGCPAVRDFVHINHKGEVEPCCMVPFAAASVHERSLVDILRMPFLTAMRDLPPGTDGIKRCLVSENVVALRRSVDAGEARGTTLTSPQVFREHTPEEARNLPTCFSIHDA